MRLRLPAFLLVAATYAALLACGPDSRAREVAVVRVRAKLPIEEKRKLADHLIDNSGMLADTERQVRELYAKLTASGARG